MSLTRTQLDALGAWIGNLHDVTTGQHRFGGVEFKVHGVGFMHFHGQTLLDIRLSTSDQALVLAEGKAEKHRAGLHSEAGWITLRIKSSEDIEKAKDMIRRAHNHALAMVEQNQTRIASTK